MKQEPTHPMAKKISNAWGDVQREKARTDRATQATRNKMIRAGEAEATLKEILRKRKPAIDHRGGGAAALPAPVVQQTTDQQAEQQVQTGGQS